MEKKRPSIITLMVALVVVILIVLSVIIILNTSTNKGGKNADFATKLNNISGEENVVIDSNGLKTNISENLNTSKIVENFEFSSFDIYSIDKKTTINFEIYNSNEEKSNLGSYELKIFDENDNLVGRVTGETGFIDGLSRKTVSFEIEGDISNLSDMQINKVIYEQV